MGTVFNKEEMLVLLQDFHRLTGLRTVVFDTYGMDILSCCRIFPQYTPLRRQKQCRKRNSAFFRRGGLPRK